MASDIIAQGMAAAAGKKASLALSKIEGVASGIKYVGEVDYYENLPSKPNLGDGYTVKYKTGGTNPDGREFVWGKSQDGTKKWIEFGPDLEPLLNDINSSISNNTTKISELNESVDQNTIDISKLSNKINELPNSILIYQEED